MRAPEGYTGLSKEELTAYANRWVARIGKQIVGQGGTPHQALQAGKAVRHKEKPDVMYIPSTPFQFSPLLDRIRTVLPDELTVFLVGGALRDTLLQRPHRDLDFVLAEDALPVARRVADQLGAAYYPLDEVRRIARLIYTDEHGVRHVLDFATFRGPDLETDLRGRDFTINALAVDIRRPQELLDPLSGAADLRAKLLRACSSNTFDDDPVRILRAVRTAAALNFHIQSKTRELIKPAISKLAAVSPERLRDELFAILAGPRVATSIRALSILGALDYVLPELLTLKNLSQSFPHTKDAWEHTLSTIEHLERLLQVLGPKHDLDTSSSLLLGVAALRLGRYRAPLQEYLQTSFGPETTLRQLLFFAAIYHDIGKASSKRVEDQNGRVRFLEHASHGAQITVQRGRKLHLSNAEIRWLETTVRNHMQPSALAHNKDFLDARSIYRFYRESGAEGVAVALLSLADLLATYGVTLSQDRWKAQIDVARILLEAWWERHDELVNPPMLLSGHDLMAALDLSPGALIGELLEAVREAQAVGEIQTQEQALAFAALHLLR